MSNIRLEKVAYVLEKYTTLEFALLQGSMSSWSSTNSSNSSGYKARWSRVYGSYEKMCLQISHCRGIRCDLQVVVTFDKTMPIMVDVKDDLSNGVISLDYIKSKRNVADPLTKGLVQN